MQDIGLKLLKSPYMNFNISVKNFMPKYKKFLYGAVRDILVYIQEYCPLHVLTLYGSNTARSSSFSFVFIRIFFYGNKFPQPKDSLIYKSKHIHNAGYLHV